ncbi:hypothetical protein B0H66DRAFT_11538 [Apodospora peruviana]|uniref:Alternative oxidase n=1 Tax=Apodospora peruviana TaxID=516989 RepID=A0AAE0IR69_9PEZI|nr:hypothetical protein B0H66DRAFT_11538 [Apodospora peruviana]
MLDSSNVSQLLKYALPLLITVWTLKYLFSHEATYTVTDVTRKFKDQKELFISDFLEHEIDGNIDGTGIAELCASKRWTPGLILTCDPAPGGIGMVKNAHLNCIRFAIEMGAELVVPKIVRRDDKNIVNIIPTTGGGPPRGEPFDYMFDFGHLNQTLSRFCPQMKVYQSMDDLYDVPEVFTARPITLGGMQVMTVNSTVIEDMSLLPQQIKSYLDMSSPPEARRYPIRFNLEVTNWAFPTAFDKPSVARNFGRLVRINGNARRIAATGLYNLQKRFSLDLDPRTGIKNGKFVGVHLRTEADVDGLFPDFETQAAYLLDYIASSKARVVFMATGAKEEHIAAFVMRAKTLNATVVLKRDILSEKDREVYDKFTWDQRALVDYEVILRAGRMAGPSESSFAWNLALRRNCAFGASEGGQDLSSNFTVQWQDAYSAIFGISEKGFVFKSTIWP